MTDLPQFFLRARDHGPASVSDHLTLQGIVEWHDRRRMLTKISRAFADPRSGYAELAGTIVFPSYGMRAAWTQTIDAMPDEQPPPDYARTSVAIRETIGQVIAKNDFAVAGTSVHLINAQAKMVTLPKSTQQVLGQSFEALSHEVDLNKLTSQHSNERLKDTQVQLAEANQQIRSLSTLLERFVGQLGNAVMPHSGGPDASH